MNQYQLGVKIETSQYSYKLIKQLDQQGDGNIFEAQNIEKNQTVILMISKIIKEERLKLMKTFQYYQNEGLVNVLDHSQKENELIIITDLFEGSFQKIYEELQQSQLQVKINYLIQLAKGLNLLHKFKLIYQDLNPQNIAYIQQQNGDYSLKLFIPGLPRPRNNKPGQFSQYLEAEYISTQILNEKSDIWALGVIFFEIISGKVFEGKYLLILIAYSDKISQKQIKDLINKFIYFDEFKLLLSQILVIDISQRFDTETIVNRLELIRQNFINQSQYLFKPNTQNRFNIGQEQYILKQKIYESSKGDVYEALNTLTKEQVVIKKQNTQSDKELVVLQKIKEANLKHFIKIINFCQQQNDIYIVMEKAQGSLNDILQSGVQKIFIGQTIEWFKQIVKGVNELHELGIIHRDLKPDNILFKRDQIGNYIFLLCDTDITTLDKWTFKTQGVGTQSYKSPEIFSKNYNEKVDIWSLGLIYYELLVDEKTLNKEFKLKKLNQNQKYDNMYNAIDSLPIETCHKKLLKGMLQKDVVTRFSANDVLQVLEQDWKQRDNSQKNAQNNFYQIWNKLQDVQNLKQQVNGYQVFGIQQNQVQNIQQQQANEKIKAQKLEQEIFKQLRQEELEKQRFEKQKEEIQRKLEKEKQEELNKLRLKDEEEQKKKLQLYQQQLEEQKKRDIEAEISKAVKALEEKNQKELAAKEKEIKEKMAKLEEQNKQLQQLDLQKYNNEKVQLEIKKQNEIDKFKQEQLLKQQQEIQKKEFEIKQQKEQELQVKLGQWQQQVKKEVEDQVRDKYQKLYEEQARNLKLKQLEEQKQLLKNKKDTLKSQLICVKVFVGNQIEFINQKKVEISSNPNYQLQQVQVILQQIEQFLQLLQTQQEFIQNELNQLDYFTEDQINTLQIEYETRLQLINEQNQQQSQIISELFSKIKLQQIETEQQKRELEQQLMNLKIQFQQKHQQSGIISNENNLLIQNWQKAIYDCHFASAEMKQQFEQIKETDQIAKAQLFQFNQLQQNRQNDVKELIQLTQNQIKQLENVFVQSNQIKQKLVYLSDYYRQQKQKYINDLEDQKLNLLNQCEAYLEQAQAIYQYQSQLSFDSVKQFYNQTIQEIQSLEQLQKQIEQLLFLFDINDIKLSFNEKQLKQYQMEVEKKNTQIKDCKNKFLVAYQEQKEAAIVQEKCKNAYNQLLGQINFQKTFEDYQNRLLNIQNQAAQLNNHELNSLITQKFSNIQQEQQAVALLQTQLKTSLLGGTIKTEEQFQIVVYDFNNKINNVKNNREKEMKAIKELEYRFQQSLTQYKSKIEQEVNEISHSIESILTEKIVANENNLKYLRNLNQLQQFDILKDGGFNKEIQSLKAKVDFYEKRYEEVQEDIKILQKEQTQQTPSSFPDQQKKKMAQLAQISDQIFEYNEKLKCQLNSCEKQQKNIKYYNGDDIEKLQQKLTYQIQQEEVQFYNFQQKLNQLNTLQNQYKNGQNMNELLSQLKNQEQQYKSSMISMQVNYFDEWQSQIERLIPVKQQFQLCRSYVFQSNLFDLERLCIRRFNKLSLKQQQQGNQHKSQANLEDKRKQDLMEIQNIQKMIEEYKSFLDKQEQILSKSENIDLDLIQEFQNIQLQINQHQQTLENAIKSNNLVKLRSNIKNQELIKKIQSEYMSHFEGNKMKIIDYLFSCIRECHNAQIQQII